MLNKNCPGNVKFLTENVKFLKMLMKMLSFSLVAEALTGLIYHRPSGENSKFLPSFGVAGWLVRGAKALTYLPDREASLIKKEYCRLSACVPTLPTGDPFQS